MKQNKLYSLSYAEMRNLIKLYGKVTISTEIDTDRFAGTPVTTIEVTESTTFAGQKATSKDVLSMDDLKRIVNHMLAEDNLEVDSIRNNAVVRDRVTGYYMGEHTEQYVSGKSFTIVVKEKENTLGSK